MDITVTGSISKSIARLRSMASPSSPDSNESKLKEIAERLCKIGEDVIRQVHGNHARVYTEPTKSGKGYRIVAEGEDLLFIDKTPTNGADGYDYIVRRVAKSLNSIAIAIRKVDVSPPEGA